MRVSPVALLVLVALPEVGAAQIRTEELQSTIARLSAAVKALPPSITPARLRESTDWLVRRSASANANDISPAYLRSLQRAAELLEGAPEFAVVRDITDELEAKVDHCRKLEIGMGGSVLLKVNTRTASGPASNWQVVYLLKIYERLADASPNNFPRLSTPTEANVEPGRYWVWARDPATGRTSDRTLVRVAGQKELLVDLPVP